MVPCRQIRFPTQPLRVRRSPQGLDMMRQASKAALRELLNEKRLVQWAPGQASCSACQALAVWPQCEDAANGTSVWNFVGARRVFARLRSEEICVLPCRLASWS